VASTNLTSNLGFFASFKLKTSDLALSEYPLTSRNLLFKHSSISTDIKAARSLISLVYGIAGSSGVYRISMNFFLIPSL